METAANLLFKARNPAIIVEDGVSKSDALAEVVKLAEMIGARIYQPWMSDVNFPVNHPLYLGDFDITSLRGREMLEKADVVVVIGALFFSQPLYLSQPLLPSGTKVVQIDNNPWQIGKNFPVDSGIEGNIKEALTELTFALQKKMTGKEVADAGARAKTIGEEKAQSDKALAEKALKEKDNVPISVTRLMQEIKDNIKPGTRIVDDCWSCSGVLRRTLGFSEAKSYQRARGGGSIGWGLPGALGVKLASPDRPVVSVSGDGSALWSIQALWTASHYKIPVTFIICANACYQQVRIMKTRLLGEKTRGRYLGTDLGQPRNDFCRIAEGMGLEAQKVEKPGQLESALKKAFDSDKPNLVEVCIDNTPP